ncbi:MAG TPA: DUF6249 domain-containing protein [Gammaproteobacteria bacterium]|nr:DUF6249 domain-containing protein [Gammaproteobacteria bacterium]
MKIVPKLAQMAVILITAAVLQLSFISIALADTPPAPAVPAAPASVDPGAQIEQAFTEANPGEEIGKAIGDAMKSMDHQELAGQALLIPILGIIGALITPMVAVIIGIWLIYLYREHKERRNHETIRLMIEKGVEIPPNFSFGEAPETGSPLNRGLKLIGIGIGLVIFFVAMGMGGIAGVGAIPLFIGLAYLLIWHLEKGKTAKAG